MRQPSKEEANKIIGEYPASQAFNFYSEIGNPIGESARSISEFIESIKVVDVSSLDFHMYREDFEKWIKALGDEALALQISNMRKSNLKGENLRKRLLQVLRLRLGTLRKIAEA